ncbi:hypothetical protein DAPPUDRAFT_320971 [Daphnia pulex]|uniref:Uncharacterized protein n=1 Tax=Daphnia pulex TaxID=6669 RepID=E9GRK9_DAPPU|nr:hypothetical protein DAPPUDRAFT_320971 [Daphnia pulex]|eukprot:EFX77896.1 hypothetical protein DAPPUDRAFT_320971 [Daphnia pulex]
MVVLGCGDYGYQFGKIEFVIAENTVNPVLFVDEYETTDLIVSRTFPKNLGAAGFNLKKEVCEIITVQQEVVAEFEVLVYLNWQRELLFIRETATPTSSSQIPDTTHILAAEFPAPDDSGVSTQHTDYQEPSTSFNSHSAPSSNPLSTSINTSSTKTVAVATNDPSTDFFQVLSNHRRKTRRIWRFRRHQYHRQKFPGVQ